MYRTTPIFWKYPINIYIHFLVPVLFIFIVVCHYYWFALAFLLLFLLLLITVLLFILFAYFRGLALFIYLEISCAKYIFEKEKGNWFAARPCCNCFSTKKKEDIWINPHNKFTIMYISKRYYYYYKELISRIIYWRILTEKQNLQFHLRSVRTNWIL